MATKTCGKPTASGGRCQKPIGPAGTCGADHKAPMAVAEVATANGVAALADPFAGGRYPREPSGPSGSFDTGVIEVTPGDRAASIAERYGVALNSEHRGPQTGYHVDVSHLTHDQVAGALTRNIHGNVEVHTGGDDSVFMVGDYDAIVATAHAATAEVHADRGLRDADTAAHLETAAENARFVGDVGAVGRTTLPATAKTTGAASLFKQRFPIGTRMEIDAGDGAAPIIGTMARGTGDYYVDGKPGPVIVVTMTDDDGASFSVQLDKPSRLTSPTWQVRELSNA
ncbi:hypothetical protein DVS28_b0224 (plasmid) [Euzebya pacifica]|uniref:Uncharacterized protein n=1 Tax=Euzebya pacifica TaxID=1608957 RepID=A0A346Y697_9ACTN|nr:hypothetical protein [Euzebya pacifica]AXV09994.1 hypothetical protein DVS28_b0224 [Euzebya pacifica]